MAKEKFISVQDKLTEHAQKTPDAIAVICADKELSYKELDQESDYLAASLFALVPEIRQGDFITLVLDRSFSVHIAIMGVLKTGAAFIPLTPDTPLERIAYSISDSKSKAIITTEKIKAELLEIGKCSCKIFTPEELLAKAKKEHLKKQVVHVSPDDMAMCIYTSGSTGNPKGVTLNHRAIYEEFFPEQWIAIAQYQIHRLADISPFTFILFYTGFFYCIYAGALFYLNKENELKDLTKFSEQIKKYQLDSVIGIPSFIEILLSAADKENFESIIGLYMGGEPLSPEHATKIFSKLPTVKIINGYGTTETCSMAVCKVLQNTTSSFTNGIPYQTKVFIVDEEGNELGPNQKGELLIQGKTLSCGYLNRPDDTAKSFIEYRGERTYKSGDLAYRTDSGEIVICGRTDDMVKLNGQRIELQEIEQSILKIEAIKQASVILKTSEKENFLVAFIVANTDISTKAIKGELSKFLPPYMIPSVYVMLDKMPLNKHGKIDKQSLKMMEISFKHLNEISSEISIENILCSAVKKVLDLKKGPTKEDNFFELGGSSISAVELIIEIEKYHLTLTVSDIYYGKTIERIAKKIQLNKNLDNNEKYEEQCRKKTFNIKAEQEFFLSEEEQKSGSNYVYNFSYVVTLGNQYDEKKICEAVDTMVQKHPMMMSVFSKDESGKYSVSYRPELIKKTELWHTSEKEFNKFKEKPERPFNLFGEHLYRTKVIVTEKNKYLFVEVHHSLGDYYSCFIFAVQTFNEYYQEKSGDDFYYSYLQDLENTKKSTKYAEAKRYYESLKGDSKWCSVLEYDHTKSFGRSAYLDYDLGISLDQMNQAEKRRSTSRNELSIAAAILALSEMTRKKKICYTWTYDNRKEGKYLETIGSFEENLPIFIDLKKTDSPSKILSEISEQILKGIFYSECLGDIFYNDELDTYTLEIIYQKHGHEDALLSLIPSEVQIEEVGLNRNAAMPFEIEVRESPSGLSLFIEYAENLYTPKQALQYAELLKKNLTLLMST
ncbi:amino acid adenylation domain-containing protein [Fibrobacter sp. UWH4]|uniref:amino acid adenylation domain-containing protein n=1 Tax=Fibrobacter sp. UWH4 TaxID=1896210 RepID=UPI00091E7306|nr:amino acid adenylation domain-containing protein [Fibrobacter sp. UWH4]SHK38669.1 amino acid adenylation domain-containing protein [Fibrobacter sp. UWH4]